MKRALCLAALFLAVAFRAQAQPHLEPISAQNPAAVAFTGGTLNGITIGATTPGTGAFTTLGASGTATIGNGSANYVQVMGGAGNPIIETAGTGPNLTLLLQGSGTGGVSVRNGSGQTIGQFISPNLSVANFLQLWGQSSGSDPSINAVGTNAGIRLVPASGGIITLAGPTLAQNVQVSPGTLTWSGSTVPNAFHPFFQNGTVTGTTTAAGAQSLNYLTVNDTLSAPIDRYVFGWNFVHTGSAGYVGSRSALGVGFTQAGQSGNKAAGAAQSSMIGLTATATATTSEGGTGTGFSASYGALWGENIVTTLSGATNFNQIHTSELDMNANSGSVFDKSILMLIGGSAETVKGASGNDKMILLGQAEGPGATSPTAYYDTGIQFGDGGSSWPFGTSATLIGINEPQNASVAAARQAVVGYGVNFGVMECTVACWNAMGSEIDGSGNATVQGLTIGNWSLALSAGSLQISSANKQTATISIHSGSAGTGWATGDKFTFGATGVGKVSAQTSGVPTALTLLVPDSEASPCTSNCSTTATNSNVYRNGGTGLKIDTTTVGPGNLILAGSSALATTATTGFMQIATMAGTPTGTVGATGQAAVVIDTTNKKLCFSTGGGVWECSAAFTP